MVGTKTVLPQERIQQIVLAVIAVAGLLVAARVLMRRPLDWTTLLVTPSVQSEVTVHVAGEVLIPGVYHLKPNSRWADAVEAARGATIVADLHAVNLAQPVRDGDRVVIPRLPDPPVPDENAGEALRTPDGVVVSRKTQGSPRLPAQPRQTNESRQRALSAAGSLDLNAASAAELEALRGIGPVLAARIVEYRKIHGRFERIEDLQEVEGVGPRLLERLRPLVQVR